MHYIWIGLIILVIIIDIGTSSFMMSWTTIAFLTAFILGYLGVPFGTQVAVAAGASIPLLFLGNHITRKFMDTKIEPYKIGVEKLIGLTVRCEEDFTDETKQQINGVFWKIETESPIKKGEVMKITAVHGNHLQVEKIIKEKE